MSWIFRRQFNFLFVSTVPGGAAAALEPTALHVPLLSLRPGAECQRECLYTHSYRSRSTPGHPPAFEVGTHGIDAETTRVGTLIVATIYLQLIQNRYMFRSFTVLQCSH